MKRKVVAAKMTALILAAGMTFGSVSFAAERKDAEAIKEENQATEAVSEGETEAAEASDSQKKTEYPVTIMTYGSDGLELETTYEKAPEKVCSLPGLYRNPSGIRPGGSYRGNRRAGQ